MHCFEFFAGKSIFGDMSEFKCDISNEAIEFSFHLVELEKHRIQLLQQLSISGSTSLYQRFYQYVCCF